MRESLVYHGFEVSKMASSSDKMAVTVDKQALHSPVNEQNARDESESKIPVSTNKHVSDVMYKKKSTFKITSVTKSSRGGSGETQIGENDIDSLEDLDETVESHTEDASSEILDGSKYEEGGDQSPLEEMNHTFTQDSESDPNKEIKDKSDVHSTRFKVVKVETKEPFRRGRWTCRDSLDTPATEGSDTKVSRESKEKDNSGNSSACSSVNYVHGVDDPSKNPLGSTNIINQVNEQSSELISDHYKSQPTGFLPQNPVHSMTGQVAWSDGSQMPPQAVTHLTSYGVQANPSNPNLSQMSNMMYQMQGLPNQQFQSMLNAMTTGSGSQAQTLQISQNQPNVPIPQATSGVPMSSQPQVHMSQGHVPIQPSSQFQMTKPSDISQQNGHQAPGTVQNIAPPIVENNSQHSIASSVPTSNPLPTAAIPNSINIATSSSENDYTQTHSSEQGRQPPTNLQTQTSVSSALPTNDNYVPQSAQTNTIQSPGDSSDKKAPSESLPNLSLSLSTSQSTSDPKASENISDNPKQEIVSLVKQDQTEQQLNSAYSSILTESAVAEAVGGITSPTKEDPESGSSTVAIDNKIEQAMDLVKSHLMYAVREEVEVLKEQIKELMEKNSQLEHENSILKASASQETLNLLSQPRQSQPPSSSS